MQKFVKWPALLIMWLGMGAILPSIFACSKPPAWTESEWNNSSETAAPTAPALGSEKFSAKIGEQTVEIQQQEIEGIPLEGSFVKSLSNYGVMQWMKAKYHTDKDLPSVKSVHQELKVKDTVMARIEPLQKTLNCKFAGEPRTELRWLGGWHLVFKRTCEAPDGSAYEVVVNSHGRLISHLPAGANMTSVTESVTLYPKGPKFSALKQIQLPVSADPNFLSVNVLEVTSDANAKFSNLGQLSQVVPSDDRFDMLQAYYYSTQSLEWIAEHLKFQYSGLKLRTQVGYPQKSNVAFYYGREIRIGQGDDITFSHMAWDPSIVIHETMHAVIEALTRLPLGQGEGGSLQEGLADILTALQLDNPQMGEASYKLAPYQRTLANDSKLADKNGSLYHDSLILSGTLWEIKSEINAAAAEDATAFLLAHLTPSSGFDDVKNQLRDWLKTLNDKEKFTAAETVLRMRGWL